jgi:single-stranded DNA-binding protein
MSALALIAGRLHGEPTTRPTKNGGIVTFFKLKVANGSATEWWDVAAFSEKAREQLEGLGEGDAVSAVGVVHVEMFEFKGEQRIKRGLTADRVLALKNRHQAAGGETRPRTGREVADASWAAPQRRGGGAHGDLV